MAPNTLRLAMAAAAAALVLEEKAPAPEREEREEAEEEAAQPRASSSGAATLWHTRLGQWLWEKLEDLFEVRRGASPSRRRACRTPRSSACNT